MTPSSRRLILLTSLFWALALAGVSVYFHYRESSPRSAPPSPVPPTPAAVIASGPPSAATSAHVRPSSQMDAPLAAVDLSPEQLQSVGVTTGTAEYKQLTSDLRATGTVAINDRLVSYVQVRFSGYVRKVFANATYQYVRKGQPLFTIYSPELVATQQEYLLARDNQQALSSSSINGVSSGADLLTSAAERRLAQWELPPSEIADLKRNGKAIPDVTVESPASGYITERNALPNMFVEPATRLYTIADLSRVWVNAQIFQNDLARLKPGDPAAVTVDAYPQKIFRGRVEQILPQLDMATRTAQVRLSIDNPGLLLKPGMFVDVDLTSTHGPNLVIPASAVFQTGLKQLVFLSGAAGHIEPREVVLGSHVGDYFVVLSGLRAHQAIVTSANFLIDSESQLQAAAGSSTPPPLSAPDAGHAEAPQPAIRIELTTDPTPPHKGSNIVRVKLTSPNGTPVTSAQVAVTFFVPAMPAMGMSAVRTTIQLADKTSGIYEGTADLGAGATWQVTISVTRNGQPAGTKQLRLSAQGGM